MQHVASSDRRWRLRAAVLAAIAATLMAIALAAPRPAHAHDICISIVNRAVACNRGGDTGIVDACDRNADGLRVRAWWSNAYGDHVGDWDPNGANSGCAHNDLLFPIYRHRICVEQPVGCSAWVLHP